MPLVVTRWERYWLFVVVVVTLLPGLACPAAAGNVCGGNSLSSNIVPRLAILLIFVV